MLLNKDLLNYTKQETNSNSTLKEFDCKDLIKKRSRKQNARLIKRRAFWRKTPSPNECKRSLTSSPKQLENKVSKSGDTSTNSTSSQSIQAAFQLILPSLLIQQYYRKQQEKLQTFEKVTDPNFLSTKETTVLTSDSVVNNSQDSSSSSVGGDFEEEENESSSQTLTQNLSLNNGQPSNGRSSQYVHRCPQCSKSFTSARYFLVLFLDIFLYHKYFLVGLSNIVIFIVVQSHFVVVFVIKHILNFLTYVVIAKFI